VFEGDHKVSHSNPARLVRFFGEQKKYDLLHTLDFDSNRKRMSVIVRSIETGQLIVFSKGAEDSIFSKCKTGDTNECDKIISEFARHGWRTLALGIKIYFKT
jgi:phospholipid-translocating ATPase